MCYAWEKKIESPTRLVCLVTQVRIQMKQFITGEIFSEKRYYFPSYYLFSEKRQHLPRYYLFPALTEKTKFFVPFVWITSARLPIKGKKITIVLSEVQCTIPYKVLYPLVEVVSRKSRVNFCIKFTVLHTIHLFYLLL